MALRAMQAVQVGLLTTQNNIANVNTKGYHRQRVEFQPSESTLIGTSAVGTGVEVNGVRRMYDTFLDGRVRESQGELNRSNTMLGYARQLDDIVADPNAGLSKAMNDFFNALGAVAERPDSTAARMEVMSYGGLLAGRFQGLQERFVSLREQVEEELRVSVTEVNTLLGELKRVNDNAASTLDGSGKPTPGMEDRRDDLVRQISEKIGVSTRDVGYGAIDLFAGAQGGMLVGGSAYYLKVVNDPTDPSRATLGLVDRPPSYRYLDEGQVKSGQMSGLFAFRDMLDEVQNSVGRAATGLAFVMNKQQTLGRDLAGNIGSAMFSQPQPEVTALSGTVGSVTATITDPGALTLDEYLLEQEGSNFLLRRVSDGELVASNTTGDFTVEGMSIDYTGTGTADRFLIQPTRFAARDFSLALTHPSQLAAASPVLAESASSNTGNGVVDMGTWLGGTGNDVTQTLTLTYDSANTRFNVSKDGGTTTLATVAYTSGNAITYEGRKFTITGIPANGDKFTVKPNTGTQDSRNVLSMAALQKAATMLNSGGQPTASFDALYNQVVGLVGSRTHEYEISVEAQQLMLKQAESEQQALSGVNLDEEAADLIQFQQAYLASSRVIQKADEMFKEMLAVVAR